MTLPDTETDRKPIECPECRTLRPATLEVCPECFHTFSGGKRSAAAMWRVLAAFNARDAFEAALMAQLVMRADNTTGECHPGKTLLQSRTGISRRKVMQALNDLQSAGCIKCVREGGGEKASVFQVWPSVLPRGPPARF